MRIKEFRVNFGRTFVPPGGDKYQPARIDCGVTVDLEPEDDILLARREAQREVRALIEETYEAQCKPKVAGAPQ